MVEVETRKEGAASVILPELSSSQLTAFTQKGPAMVPQSSPGVRLFRIADAASGAFVLASAILGPWLFGTTENWSVWLLNAISYLAGISMLVKWLVRWRTGAVAVEGIWR